jgi:UPF0755 protein
MPPEPQSNADFNREPRPTAPPRSANDRMAAGKPAQRRDIKIKTRGKPTRLGPFVKFVSGMLTVFCVMAALVGGGVMYLQSLLDKPGPGTETRIVSVPRGDGYQEIATRLEREGLIADRTTFVAAYFWARVSGLGNLKAGDYEVKPQATIRSILDTLAEGKSVETRVTIPEGLTSFQIVERLRADQNLTGDIRDIPAEGTLLPETYRVPRGATRQRVIELMQSEQRKLMERLWKERQDGLPFKTPQEAIILASIVEKETGRNDERERVAGVFVNRLRQKMRLESDPTILYGMFLGKVNWGRSIFKSEIRAPTAHNTYTIAALPPTPICNPGRLAIEATLKPKASKEIFFVANGQGGHFFAETLREHNVNVQRYRQIEAARGQAVPATVEEVPAAPPPVAPTIQPAPPKKTRS